MSAMSSIRSSSRLKPTKPDVKPSAAPAVAPKRAWYWLSSGEQHLLIVSTAIKVLLFPAYRSTDFEVHRNWLAITHSLPLSKWYFDTGSEWTLDYPPFFAYFERVLSMFGYIVDPKIVQMDNLGYLAWSAVAFQRTTVILSELVLATGLIKWSRRSQKPDYPTASIIAASVLLHPGLLIVDHIHFQYNGFLLGLLVWSIVAAREENFYMCAALFAALLNFKHIFVYLAPPFFVFLLRRHCFSPARKFQSDRLVELGLLVASIFGVSFGPFLLAGGFSQIKQIFSRLFPFQRGLNHAYWAGNVWAILSAVDRILVKYLLSRGLSVSSEAISSSSRGLIGATTFGVLPQITPRICFTLTLIFNFMYSVKLWFDPSYKRFLNSIVLSAFTSFLFGWHVHEKAILLGLIPLSLVATQDDSNLRAYFVATMSGVVGLFPLMIQPAETPIKLLFSILWASIVFPSLRKVVYRPLPTLMTVLVSYAEMFYLAGFILLQIYVDIIHNLLFPSAVPPFKPVSSDSTIPLVQSLIDDKVSNPKIVSSMEFFPLMLTSIYCAIGISWAWLRLSWNYMTS